MKFCSADSRSQMISSSLHLVTPFKLKKQDQGHTLSPFFYLLHLKTPVPFYSHIFIFFSSLGRDLSSSLRRTSLCSQFYFLPFFQKCPLMLLSLSSIWNLYSLVFNSTVKKTFGSNSNSTIDLLCDLGQVFNLSVSQIPHPIESST